MLEWGGKHSGGTVEHELQMIRRFWQNDKGKRSGSPSRTWRRKKPFVRCIETDKANHTLQHTAQHTAHTGGCHHTHTHITTHTHTHTHYNTHTQTKHTPSDEWCSSRAKHKKCSLCLYLDLPVSPSLRVRVLVCERTAHGKKPSMQQQHKHFWTSLGR